MGRKRGVQYRPGSFYRLDDRSGFARRAEDTKFEWTELIVGDNLWEARQPQDFVRGVTDDQTVPDPRSDPPPTYIGPFSIALAEEAAVGASILYLENLIGLTVGDPIGVMDDQGQYLYAYILALIPAEAAVLISRRLVYYASSGNLVTDFLRPTLSPLPPRPRMDFSIVYDCGYEALISGAC